MDFRLLRSFVAVAEELSFRKAAKRLNISQPPLSRQIKELEEQLQVTLFRRLQNRIELTREGLVLQEEGERLLEHANFVERLVHATSESHYSLVVVGYSGTLMDTMLPSLLRFLTLKVDKTLFKLREMPTVEQTRSLLSGTIDLAFVRHWAIDDNIQFEPLGTETFFLIYPKDLLPPARVQPGMADLGDEPFIAASRDAWPHLFELVLEICRDGGITPRVEYECDHTAAVLRLVEEGLGWTVLPMPDAFRTHRGNLGLIPLRRTSVFGLGFRREPLTPQVARVVGIIREFFSTIEKSPA